jgi:heme-degrading monooxygenase HmoA
MSAVRLIRLYGGFSLLHPVKKEVTPMFARLFTFQFQPDSALIAKMEKFNQENMPVLREQKGFIKMYLLLDRVTGKGGQVQLWASEADLLAYLNGPVARDIQSRAQAIVKDYVVSPPKGENYSVIGES